MRRLLVMAIFALASAGPVHAQDPQTTSLFVASPTTLAGVPLAASQSSSRTRDDDRDSLWNGILIGAALGVVATQTTAAEAPTDGKVVVVALAALAGAWIDARLERVAGIGGRPGPVRLTVGGRVRF